MSFTQRYCARTRILLHLYTGIDVKVINPFGKERGKTRFFHVYTHLCGFKTRQKGYNLYTLR